MPLFSLRSKCFCPFSEQRKTEERDFDNFAAQEMGTTEKIERGGRGGGISPVAKLSKSRSSIFLCSENRQKRLRRRLALFSLNVFIKEK